VAAKALSCVLTVVVCEVTFREHAFVENPNDTNAVLLLPAENDVMPLPVPTESRAYVIGTPTEIWLLCETMKAIVQLPQVTPCLVNSPSLLGILPNPAQIDGSSFGKPKRLHQSDLRSSSSSSPSSV
jgi:hypothetical protein